MLASAFAHSPGRIAIPGGFATARSAALNADEFVSVVWAFWNANARVNIASYEFGPYSFGARPNAAWYSVLKSPDEVLQSGEIGAVGAVPSIEVTSTPAVFSRPMKLMSWRPSEYSHCAGHCARLLHQVG